MDASAAQRGFEGPEEGSTAADGPADDATLIAAARIVQQARQDYLDALPIAAAVLQRSTGGTSHVHLANALFLALAGPRACPDVPLAAIAFLAGTGVAARAEAFLAGDERDAEFEARYGEAVAQRHFSVRLARLEILPALGRRCLATIVDRTAQVETEQSLRAEMLRDSLTGLPNRTAFNEAVEGVLADPAFQPGGHGVLVVDMRRFSRVNECVGAIAGDELLITFARRLCSVLRAGDVLARTGGDEFGILMRLEKGLDDALQAAERIRAALVAPFRLSELEIRVDCAFGCALLSGHEELADEVLRNAQFALKRAKASGEIQIYEPNQARAARRRFSIETELRHAIEGGDLQLAFQPLVDLADGTVAGFEALARWSHPRRGAISPTEFIPVAEESGLIVPLGRWALDAALAVVAGWDAAAGAPLPIPVSVNLSAIQLARDDVPSLVADALSRHGIDGARLTLELTESAIVQDPARATKVLHALQELAVRAAMDDFGTGYTSLAYLQRLPIDVLKIDRSFVSDMLADADSVAIVRAILSLARALGMETTAEGIDRPELAEALEQLGCTHGQGFYFARPLAPDAALAYWRARSA
ncbi:MAG: bifunctional diguanylate cyclase/phosphodiesterase [Alphaproteobacteria bacterium]|nr:bifunctional diguanylate cyclase/phosphodiesterase [Alphaproteobacteria bacterium]